MPEVGLYGAGIVVSVGEGVPAGMAEHVGMWVDREARTLSTLGKHHIHLGQLVDLGFVGGVNFNVFDLAVFSVYRAIAPLALKA